MDKNSNSFVMIFAVTMCVALAIVLAGTFSMLRERMEENELFDQQVNVLIATGLYSRAPDAEPKARKELEELYANYIEAKVLEVKRAIVKEQVREAGEEKTVEVSRVVDLVETDIGLDDLPRLRIEEARKPKPGDRREFTTFFTRIDDAGEPVAYCIPIEGLGLWGMIYGYLALEADLDTVKGITFFRHKETPGLGGEIDAQWWQSQWPGKAVFDDDRELVGITVKKGKVDGQIPREAKHFVDGLSGATITSNGVTKFVREDLQTYLPYFEKLKKGA